MKTVSQTFRSTVTVKYPPRKFPTCNMHGNGLFAARIWFTRLVVPRPIKSIHRCMKFNTIACTCTRAPSSDTVYTPLKQMLVTCIPACLMASSYMANTQMHLVYPLDLPNSSNHTELLTFSCVRSTVRSESCQLLDCSLTHTVVVSTATFFYTRLVHAQPFSAIFPRIVILTYSLFTHGSRVVHARTRYSKVECTNHAFTHAGFSNHK